MSNIITKAHPVPDMHSTGLRVVGAWLFAIVLILFSTVFVHVPYTRTISSQRLINRIIYYLIDQMMKSSYRCTSNIHTRSFTNSFQSFQNLDLVRAVLCILSAHLLPPVILYSL